MNDFVLIGSVFAFGLGACIASFLNVVIWRVPRGESIVSPPSHCPKCNAPIKWYQNIPILAWLALRGKCANCRAPISPRYILIETLGGILFLAAFLRIMWGVPLQCSGLELSICVIWLFSTWIWISLMIVGSMIDYDLKLLPDFVTVGGMILGVLTGGSITLVECIYYRGGVSYYPLLSSITGLALGFGLLWLVRYIGSKAFKREAMGLGDVFLMGAVGALNGPLAVLFTLIFSSVFGSIVGIGMIALSKTRFGRFLEIPFGPYICLAALLWFFYGPELVNMYLGAFR